MGFEIENTEEFNAWINDNKNRSYYWQQKVLDGIGQYAIAYLENHWSPNVPSDPYTPPAVRTGTLSNSAEYEVAGSTVTVKVDTKYARYLEEGTEHMIERPYFSVMAQYLVNNFDVFIESATF